MPKGHRYEFPPDEEILRGSIEHGSYSAYAVQGLGIAGSTLARHLSQHPDLKRRIQEATAAKLADAVPPAGPSGRSRELTWPSDEALVEGCVNAGSIHAYASALGVGDSVLRSRVNKRGLRPAIDERIAEKHTVLQPAERPPQPGDDVSREEALESEVKELRALARRDRKDEVQRERLAAAIEGALVDVPPPRRVGPAPVRRLHGKEEPHHRQMVLLSDWHGGEVVDPESINNLNAYNWEIMEERVEEVIAAMLSHKANSPALTGLDIALLGDMTSGNAHRELAETNEFPLAVQGVKMGHLIGQTIERLVEHYTNIRVVSVVGNHPRLPQKPASKNVHDNMDWVSAMIAREFLSEHPTVQFSVPTGGAALHTIAGRTMYVWHSDGVRSSMPGVPWGGIMRRINEIRRSYTGKQIDYWACGHWHQANCMVDLGLFMNGSLIGRNEWGIKSFGGGSDPTQVLLTFSEKHRWLTDARFLTPKAGLPGTAALAA